MMSHSSVFINNKLWFLGLFCYPVKFLKSKVADDRYNAEIGLGGISSLYDISIYFYKRYGTVNIGFDTSASKKNIYSEEDTDWTAAEYNLF